MNFYGLMGATIGLTVAFSASAAPTGEEQLSYSVANNGLTVIDGKGQVSLDLSTPLAWSYAGPPYGHAGATAVGAPTVTATAITGATALNTSVRSRAGLDYWLEVNGPTGERPVPIDYISRITVSASGRGGGNEGSTAFAQFILQEYTANADGSPNRNLSNINWALDAQTRYSSKADIKTSLISGVYQLVAGNLLATAIIADVSAQDGGSASALADPYFFIDPIFSANHPGYSLSFSPFAGNVRPVANIPEPADLGAMMLGCGLAGAALRRSKIARTPDKHAGNKG